MKHMYNCSNSITLNENWEVLKLEDERINSHSYIKNYKSYI